MAGTKINLLGGLEIADLNEKPLPRKAKAVAAFLALRNGKPQSRERIGAMFWESSPEEQARTNVRQCLSVLRKHFGNALVADAATVHLDASVVETDVARFESLIGANDRAVLEQASEVYKGDLLDGFSFKEESFEAWIRSEREHYRDLMVGGLMRLVEQCEAEGDLASAVKHATRLLSLDPINENVHRALMRAYAAQGRHDAALRQFETCKGVLQRVLGVEPQPETGTLHREILQRRRTCAEEQPDALPQDTVQNPSPRDRPSVAILPFANMSGDPEQDYFSDGITEDLIIEISRFRELAVVSSNSSFVFKGKRESLRGVSSKLKAQYIVEGSVRKSGHRVRVTAQLIDANDDKHIWAERYDRALEDIFDVQDDIVRRIASTLVGRLEAERLTKIKRQSSDQLRAYDLFLRGRERFFKWSIEDNRQAALDLRAAMELEPDNAAVLALLAEVLLRMWLNGWSDDPQKDRHAALDLAKRADEIDDGDSRTQTSLGMAYLFNGDPDKAKHHFEAALRINPNDTRVIIYYSRHAVFDGETDKAVKLCRQALTLNPYGKYNWNLGLAHFVARDYEEAITLLGAIRNPPETVLALLAASYAMVDRMGKAQETFERFEREIKETPVMSGLHQPSDWREYYAQRWPFRDQAEFEHLTTGLRKAGLPI